MSFESDTKIMIKSSQYRPELPFHRITSIKEHIKFLHTPSIKFAMY